MKSTKAYNEERSGNLSNTDKNDEIVHNTLLSPEKKEKKIWLVILLKKKRKTACISTPIGSVTNNTTALKRSHPIAGFTMKTCPEG